MNDDRRPLACALIAAATLALAACEDPIEDAAGPPEDQADIPALTTGQPQDAAATHDHDDHDRADQTGADQDSTPAQQPAASQDAYLAYGGAMMKIPEEWVAVPVNSTLRTVRNQYRIPGANDAGPGSATVYVGTMGPVDMNLQRWVGQIANPQGEVKQSKHNGRLFVIHEVRGTGTVAQAMGPAGSGDDDSTLMALVIVGGTEGDMYIKAVGPADTMAAYEDDWQDLIDSILNSGPMR